MLTKISEFVKNNFSNIALVIIVMLLMMFSFAAGYIMSNYAQKQPLEVINQK
jgi:hypothetical protein